MKFHAHISLSPRIPIGCRLMYGSWLACLAIVLAGCSGEDSDDRSSGQRPRQSNSGSLQLQSAPPRSADPNLDDPGPSAGEPGADGDPPAPERDGDTVQQTAPVQPDQQPAESSSSALDAAVEAVAGQPEVDPYPEQKIEPAEPHAELQPLIQADWKRLHPGYEVWLDTKNKQVVVGGRICFRDGPLEMFACPMHTKEHESIVATVSNAEIIHIGLLAVGAIPGKPFQWDPEYAPASGPVIRINVAWNDDGQRREIKAQDMILDIVTNEPLQHEWVFCGSGEWRDPDNPDYREYFADGGDMICVTNFTTALLDLQIESSSMQEGLRYHANPRTIPPLGKPVLLMLKPDLGTNPQPAETGDEPVASGDAR